MANAVKGEVPFRVAGETYALVIDFNALCTIDTELGIEASDIGDALSSRFPVIRSVFRIGLEAKHPGLNDHQVGELIGQLGIKKAAELLAKAIKLGFPDLVESAEGKGPAATEAAGT